MVATNKQKALAAKRATDAQAKLDAEARHARDPRRIVRELLALADTPEAAKREHRAAPPPERCCVLVEHDEGDLVLSALSSRTIGVVRVKGGTALLLDPGVYTAVNGAEVVMVPHLTVNHRNERESYKHESWQALLRACTNAADPAVALMDPAQVARCMRVLDKLLPGDKLAPSSVAMTFIDRGMLVVRHHHGVEVTLYLTGALVSSGRCPTAVDTVDTLLGRRIL